MSEKSGSRRRLPSPATVLAAIAVFAVFAGTATAAGVLIDGKQIKKGTITAKQIKNKSLSANKLNRAAIKKLRGNAGPRGPQGEPGPQGERGVAGAPGIVKPVTASAGSANIADGADVQLLTAAVPAAGSYVVNAKTNLFAVQDTVGVECRIATDAGIDSVQWTSPEANSRQPVSLQGVTTAAPGDPIRFFCEYEDGNGSAYATKLTAIPVG